MNSRKFVLITGCSSGIGLSAAQLLKQRGYRVIPSCRQAKDVAHLQQQGFENCIQLDLADSGSIQSAVEQVRQFTDGQLFALFNNGAYGQPGALEDLTRDALRKQFETNLFGTHELTTAVIPMMLKLDDARIIQNSSILGFVASPNRGAYIASKYALEGLTDTLRLELMDSPIKVSLIEPGPITSAFRQNALAALQDNVDFSNSRHQQKYQQALARLTKEGPSMKFTLPASAVVKKLIHALESPHPKVRYHVTVHTHVAAVLKRLLTDKMFDAVLHKFGSA